MQKAAPKSATLSLGTKLAFGFGSVAYGIKDGGFAYFLLLFYSQVIGLDAGAVGLAITLALIVDAVSDPIVGYWSDNLHSRWGRRHPFLYASAIPVAATYYLLWNPPVGWSNEALFWYLFGFAVLIRTFITFNETPSSALTPELTADYDERATLISWRLFFGWTGGNAMSVMMFMALFPAFATATTTGQFNRDAYATYGVIAAGLMGLSILLSALGTHSRIPHLKPPPPKRRMTLSLIFKEVFETLSNRSFVALFVANVFGSIGAGLSAALAFYITTYFWKFSPLEIGVLTLGVFLSAIIGAVMAPIVTRTIGKKRGAMIIGLIAFLGAPLPIVLKLAGLIEAGTHQFVFILVLIAGIIDVGLIICFQILAAAMMADLVEQSELKTGRRSEGTFVAAATFIRKMVSGLGVMAATVVLALAGLKAGVKPEDVPADVVWRLGAYYVPIILTFWMAMMAAIAFYRLDRSDHEENLRQLAERNAG
ncbi:MAG: MFS transporter [Alphaproteobacteria bacterium]|nr:MFS transporter [Alphaproteobacteria bacterium]